MKKVFCAFAITCACMLLTCCVGGEKCLPDKEIGDVVIITAQTFGATDRATYNKMMDAAKKGDNSATVDMLLAGQLRMVQEHQRGTLKDKDGTRAQVLLPDDNREWWINADFLK